MGREQIKNDTEADKSAACSNIDYNVTERPGRSIVPQFNNQGKKKSWLHKLPVEQDSGRRSSTITRDEWVYWKRRHLGVGAVVHLETGFESPESDALLGTFNLLVLSLIPRHVRHQTDS
ncbi:hypothetical protein DAPPUDRAFT_246446 [Daphnia pulex]|uniref:Uncharacterized protein n=1 Tax=Daphnia pulex TaxID=6669 RepID=E9GQJ1_DAPPU|nr:hypothetical protein DAPPUDRAFT_246446 [Daphnia pulex]|eukprot:EFX78322.1 hypothetical protein DAPPUDRAFT_246446 [Daphnia pulex]